MTMISSYKFISSKIKEYVVEPDCTSIGEYAFAYCSFLKTLQLPNSVKEFKKSAFQNCSSLKDIILPDSLEIIEEKALSYCFLLELIAIPKNVKFIGDLAFEGCRKLTYVEFLSPTVELRCNIFKDCTSLECVYVPKGSKSYFISLLPQLDNIIFEQ